MNVGLCSEDSERPLCTVRQHSRIENADKRSDPRVQVLDQLRLKPVKLYRLSGCIGPTAKSGELKAKNERQQANLDLRDKKRGKAVRTQILKRRIG